MSRRIAQLKKKHREIAVMAVMVVTTEAVAAIVAEVSAMLILDLSLRANFKSLSLSLQV